MAQIAKTRRDGQQNPNPLSNLANYYFPGKTLCLFACPISGRNGNGKVRKTQVENKIKQVSYCYCLLYYILELLIILVFATYFNSNIIFEIIYNNIVPDDKLPRLRLENVLYSGRPE